MINFFQKKTKLKKSKSNSEFKISFFRSQSYFWKRCFYKWGTWILLIIYLLFFVLIFKAMKNWAFGMQTVESPMTESQPDFKERINPIIKNTNDFFTCVLPNLIYLPLIICTSIINPLSWLFWKSIGEISQKTQKDGTDSFFLATEIPTSRRQIFWRKLTFLVISLTLLHLVFFSLPLTLLLLKTNYFANFTPAQTLLFLGWNFLITPLFLFLPLTIFLSSLASLNSIWYPILKSIGNFFIFFLYLIQMVGLGGKFSKLVNNFLNWQKNHYLLTILVIMGITIILSLFVVRLAYKDFQKKDLK